MGVPEASTGLILIAIDGRLLVFKPGSLSRDKPSMLVTPLFQSFASLSSCANLSSTAQAGETKIGEVVKAGGFTQFRRATQTQVNIIYEARPQSFI
jgi:hypothetical protein